jgi:hypothetical protein
MPWPVAKIPCMAPKGGMAPPPCRVPATARRPKPAAMRLQRESRILEQHSEATTFYSRNGCAHFRGWVRPRRLRRRPSPVGIAAASSLRTDELSAVFLSDICITGSCCRVGSATRVVRSRVEGQLFGSVRASGKEACKVLRERSMRPKKCSFCKA